jgi:hypothetical protein
LGAGIMLVVDRVDPLQLKWEKGGKLCTRG